MAKSKILLTDDHKIIRDGIRAMLDELSDYTIAGEAENGLEAIDFCREHPVDFVLMDIDMPEMNGIEATRQIREQFPRIKILALTMMQEEQHIRKMVRAGASGYILKNSGIEELENALEALSNDKHYFSDETTRAVMMDLVNPKKKNVGKSSNLTDLTNRELEVLQLICQEYTNQEIADKLFISVRTVDAHRRNLMQKTGARNAVGLARYAIEHDLVDPSGNK